MNRELRSGFNEFAGLIHRRYGVRAEVVKHVGGLYVAGPSSAFEQRHRICKHGWYGEGSGANEALQDFWVKHQNDISLKIPVRAIG